jgi:hypothetical protein
MVAFVKVIPILVAAPLCAGELGHSRSKAGGSQSCHDHSDAYAAAMSALARGSSRIPPPIRFIA